MPNRESPAALLLLQNHISGWISLAVHVYCLTSLIQLQLLVCLKLCVSSIFQQTRCKTLQTCGIALKSKFNFSSLLYELSGSFTQQEKTEGCSDLKLCQLLSVSSDCCFLSSCLEVDVKIYLINETQKVTLGYQFERKLSFAMFYSAPQ